MKLVSAIKMAEAVGIPEKRFRQALRNAVLPWHVHNTPWIVEVGSSEYNDMLSVLQQLSPLKNGSRKSRASRKRSATSSYSTSDETYVIGLCDDFLKRRAIRQHKFDFLCGDPGKNGKTAMLPVDAWYPDLALVIEYRERQHTEAVALWDGKPTVSGVNRGEQRRLYDQRRRDLLPTRGIRLVEFDIFEFQYRSGRRLARCPEDRHIIAAKLSAFAS